MVSCGSRPNTIVVVCVTTGVTRACRSQAAVFAHCNLPNVALRPSELKIECDYLSIYNVGQF